MRRLASAALLLGAIVLAGCHGDGSVVLPHTNATTTSSTTTTTVGQRPQSLVCPQGKALMSTPEGVYQCGTPAVTPTGSG
jgi:hypothetical protein